MKQLLPHSLLPLALLLTACGLGAANPDIPHRNQGLIKPYDGAPPEVDLSSDESAKVHSGQAIYKQFEYDGGGRAVAVFRVNASAKKVWHVISDFSKFVGRVEKVEKAEVYKREGDKIYVAFTLNLGLFGGTWTYYIEHNYPMDKEGWGTWKLDYSRSSDLDDSVGFWRVNQISPTESIVTYSVEIRVGGVLGFLRNIIVDKGLQEATQWVKVYAEKPGRP